jgi:hypothetical protein
MTATKQLKKPLSRYADSFPGNYRSRKGKREWIPNPTFGKGQPGTPLFRLEEVLRDANAAFVKVRAGDLNDFLADAPAHDELVKGFREQLAKHQADIEATNAESSRLRVPEYPLDWWTQWMRVRAADVKKVIALMTPPPPTGE